MEDFPWGYSAVHLPPRDQAIGMNTLEIYELLGVDMPITQAYIGSTAGHFDRPQVSPLVNVLLIQLFSSPVSVRKSISVL